MLAKDTGGPAAGPLLDATDEAALLSLGRRQYDAAVCSMAFMDMTAIEPLLSALGANGAGR